MILPSRTGQPFARIGDVHLHSPFDPAREADRFARHALDARQPRTVVILGSGLGYLIGAVRALSPTSRIVAINYTDLRGDECVLHAPLEWHAEGETGLREFLRNAFDDDDVQDLKIIDWNAAASAYPERAREAREILRDVVQELNSAVATTGYFGRRWLRNIVHNFVAWKSLRPLPVRKPLVVIAAPGPSLEESLEVVRTHREALTLWALPSSTAALVAAGLVPELVILTDGGYYAGEHVARLPTGSPLAMPLTGAFNARGSAAEIVPVSQMTLPEQHFAGSLEIAPLQIPSAGTVAATALALASAPESPAARVPEAIVFAGFDLANRDVRSHARPHAFDHYLTDSESRIRPALTVAFGRTIPGSTPIAAPDGEGNGPVTETSGAFVKWRTSRALETYAAWFRHAIPASSIPVYRIWASAAKVGTVDIDEDEFSALCRRFGRGNSSGPGSRHPPTELQTDASGRMLSRAQRIEVAVDFLRAVRASFERSFGILSRGPDSALEPFDRLVFRWLDMPAYLRARRGATAAVSGAVPAAASGSALRAAADDAAGASTGDSAPAREDGLAFVDRMISNLTADGGA